MYVYMYVCSVCMYLYMFMYVYLLLCLYSDVTDEVNRTVTKERYMNSQFTVLSNNYKEVR